MTYQQGNLDGLCGIYSIINATKSLGIRCSQWTWQDVFLEIIELIYHNKCSHQFITDGLSTPDISKALRQVICHRFDVHYTKPYHRQPGARLRLLWKTLYVHLNSEQNRSAIVCIESPTHAHWTVVQSLSHKRLTLLDSSGRSHINRHLCTTTEVSESHPILIYPTTVL